MLKVTFIAKDIKVTKEVREDRIERFREDMLAKFGLMGKKEPHAVKTEY